MQEVKIHQQVAEVIASVHALYVGGYRNGVVNLNLRRSFAECEISVGITRSLLPGGTYGDLEYDVFITSEECSDFEEMKFSPQTDPNVEVHLRKGSLSIMGRGFPERASRLGVIAQDAINGKFRAKAA